MTLFCGTCVGGGVTEGAGDQGDGLWSILGIDFAKITTTIGYTRRAAPSWPDRVDTGRPLQSTVTGIQGLRVNGWGTIVKRRNA
jgi:hypothetical protein